jgi:hypothetical protein
MDSMPSFGIIDAERSMHFYGNIDSMQIKARQCIFATTESTWKTMDPRYHGIFAHQRGSYCPHKLGRLPCQVISPPGRPALGGWAGGLTKGGRRAAVILHDRACVCYAGFGSSTWGGSFWGHWLSPLSRIGPLLSRPLWSTGVT